MHILMSADSIAGIMDFNVPIPGDEWWFAYHGLPPVGTYWCDLTTADYNYDPATMLLITHGNFSQLFSWQLFVIDVDTTRCGNGPYTTYGYANCMPLPIQLLWDPPSQGLSCAPVTMPSVTMQAGVVPDAFGTVPSTVVMTSRSSGFACVTQTTAQTFVDPTPSTVVYNGASYTIGATPMFGSWYPFLGTGALPSAYFGASQEASYSSGNSVYGSWSIAPLVVYMHNNSAIPMTVTSPVQTTIAAEQSTNFYPTRLPDGTSQLTLSFRLGSDSGSPSYTFGTGAFSAGNALTASALPGFTPSGTSPFMLDVSGGSTFSFDDTYLNNWLSTGPGNFCSYTIPFTLKPVTKVTISPEVLPITVSGCTAFLTADGSAVGSVPASSSSPPVPATISVITDTLPAMTISSCA
jgi:hypothetical protein